MTIGDLILRAYCAVGDALKALDLGRLRRRGPGPELADAEVIAIELVGEFLGLDADRGIFEHSRRYHRAEFPRLAGVHRTTFARQAANLWAVKQRVLGALAHALAGRCVVWLVDSFPLYACPFARAPRCRRFRGSAAYGKDELVRRTFYGFRVHLRCTPAGLISQIELAPANASDLAVAEADLPDRIGTVVGDRNYWSPEVQAALAPRGVRLLAPYRSAKRDPDREASIRLVTLRRRIETTIGQLVERLGAKRTWARDEWHLWHRLLRKVLSHTVAALINRQDGREPLQLASLLAT